MLNNDTQDVNMIDKLTLIYIISKREEHENFRSCKPKVDGANIYFLPFFFLNFFMNDGANISIVTSIEELM